MGDMSVEKKDRVEEVLHLDERCPSGSPLSPTPSRSWGGRWESFRKKISISKYALGIFLIICVSVIWVTSSEWIQHIFEDLDFNKPYFLTYFNTTGFALWNFGFLLPSWRRVPWKDRVEESPVEEDDEVPAGSEPIVEIVAGVVTPSEESGGVARTHSRKGVAQGLPSPGTFEGNGADGSAPLFSAVEVSPPGDNAALGSMRWRRKTWLTLGEIFCAEAPLETEDDRTSGDDLLEDGESSPRCRRAPIQPYSLRHIWTCAAYFCPFWFLANYLFNLSLSYTSVASNSILSSTSSIWTLLLSYIMLRHPVNFLKWIAVGMYVGGTIMVGMSDHSSSTQNTIAGDAAALMSAFFYAVYTSILKRFLPEDDRYAMGMVFGAVGVLNLVFLWPGLLIVHYTGFEPFVLPTTSQFWPLALNALIGTNLSDVLWAKSVVLTSPVVATLGLALTTPLSMIMDTILRDEQFSPLYIAGAVLVTIGFITVNVPSRWITHRLRYLLGCYGD